MSAPAQPPTWRVGIPEIEGWYLRRVAEPDIRSDGADYRPVKALYVRVSWGMTSPHVDWGDTKACTCVSERETLCGVVTRNNPNSTESFEYAATAHLLKKWEWCGPLSIDETPTPTPTVP